MKKPSIRFKGFTEDWEQRKLDNNIIEYHEVTTENNQYPALTSSRKGIFLQTEYFAGNQIASEDNAGYNVVPYGYFTYRHMSDDEIFHFNINDIIENGIVSTLYPVFTTDEELDSRYLQYQLNYGHEFAKYAVLQKQGGSRTYMYLSKLKKLYLTMPKTVQEQKRISDFFIKLDRLITLHQRKYDKLVNVKKSMLEKMFPREGKNIPEIRFSGFTETWEQRKLSEIATMHARIGWQNLRTSEFLDSGNYMLITGTDFEDGAINFDTCHYVERERYEQDKHIQIKNGSILITKDGTLGKVAYVQGLSMPATLNAGVFNVEIKDETKVDNKYLFQYLKAPYLMDYVDKKATGGTIKHLNQNILIDFPVVMPSKQEQRLIGAYFNQLDHLITLHQREVEKLKNIKKSCLEKMFV